MEAMLSILNQVSRIPLFVFIALVVSVISAGATPSSTVHAAACGSEPSSTTGRSSQQVTVPATDTYTIWSRIKAPDTSPVQYTVYIDGQCFVVGQTAQAPDTLTWVDYQDGSSLNKATVSLSAGTHTLVLTAGSEDLELDRVMLLSDNCVPTGTGDNCLNDTTLPNTAITSPTNSSTVGSTTTITATATDNDSIDYVEFYRGGSTLLGTDSSSPYSYDWDTTSVADGAYSLTARAYDISGNVRTSSTVGVTVNNTPPTDAVIDNFSASPPSITDNPSDSSQLSWSVSAGTGCSISNGVGTVNLTGTREVSPSSTTVYTLTCNGLSGGASDSEQLTVTVTPAPDSDGDGIKDYIELAAPNSGDANYDTVLDSLQANVTSFVNTRTGAYNSLVAAGDCDVLGTVTSASGKAAYLMGTMAFTLTCPSAGQAAQIELVLDQEYDTTSWSVMKVNSGLTIETDISDQVSISSVDMGGQAKTSLTYALVDGGELDEDDAANGTIVDPLAINFNTTESITPPIPQVGAPNAGVGNKGQYSYEIIALMFGIISLGAGVMWYFSNISRTTRANRRN